MSDTNPERSKVHIPENWAALPWVGPSNELTIRALGALVSDSPIKNRNDAVFAIQAEVDRREAEEIGQPAPQPPAAPPPVDPNLVTSETVAPTAPAPEPEASKVALAPVAGPREVPARVEAGAVLKEGTNLPPPMANTSGMCRVRITKKGAGQVFTGRTSPKTYDWQAEVALPRTVALGLEDKGYGEILD